MATIDDVEQVKQIDCSYDYEQYSKEMIRSSILNDVNILAILDDVIVGYVSASIVLDEAELLKIVVAKECRGMGIGKRLIQQLFEVLKVKNVTTVFLEVRKSNVVAKQMYLQLGFQKIFERKEYYDGDDAEVFKIEFGK